MRVFKWFTILLLLVVVFWAGYVTWFESWLGYAQPMNQRSLVLATFDDNDGRRERVLSLRQIDDGNYIAVNHWPRMWYNRALANPQVEVRMPGEEGFAPYVAVPLEGAELARVEEAYPVPLSFKFRTGFPPRRFMRLDAADAPSDAPTTP